MPNVAQTERALMGIRLMMSFVPLAFIILGMIVLAFYPINDAMHRRIVQEIDSKMQNKA